jgi:predicted transcriptional regulator
VTHQSAAEVDLPIVLWPVRTVACCLGLSSLDWILLLTTLYSCAQWAKSCPVACCLGLSSLDIILLLTTLYSCTQWAKSCSVACCWGLSSLDWILILTTLYYCPQWVIQLRGMILGLSFPHLIEICSVLHCIPVHSGQNLVCCLGLFLTWLKSAPYCTVFLYTVGKILSSGLLLMPFLTWLNSALYYTVSLSTEDNPVQWPAVRHFVTWLNSAPLYTVCLSTVNNPVQWLVDRPFYIVALYCTQWTILSWPCLTGFNSTSYTTLYAFQLYVRHVVQLFNGLNKREKAIYTELVFLKNC